ncbi:MAG: hypothetical protein IH851_11195 [Armatimonadetes bacterium]|nr:hypothetical protein [Armatimonadota bacterium]
MVEFLAKRPHMIPAIAAAAMLFYATGDHPYGYYQLLRVVVCVSALVATWVAVQEEIVWAIWVFGAIAVLFNPLIPVHLNKETWRYIDGLSGVLFVVGGVLVARKAPPAPEED